MLKFIAGTQNGSKNKSYQLRGECELSKKLVILSFIAVLLPCMVPALAKAQSNRGLIAWWKFDQGSGNRVLESIHQVQNPIVNRFEWVPGVSGTGLKFDGFTTVVTSDVSNTPHLGGSFTIEAWIALHQYPVNWVAIVDQEKKHGSGYYFGVDAEGRLGLQLEVQGNWEKCASSVRLPLMKWVHVVGVYDEQAGIRLYVDGKPAGSLAVRGGMTPANDTGMRIGRNFVDLPPTALVRQSVSFPALYSLDGIIDDLKIYDRALSPQELEQAHASIKPANGPALAPRTWPVIPTGPNDFMAVYCKLDLYPTWDALWRSGPFSDVVVRFEGKPYKYVFWRGTNFEENLVTENNIWVGDQSFESGTHNGCAEHMSDKKALHQSIDILESSPARVVLHWRYGLVDVTYKFSNVDPLTGWGDWADEYFYIYPDGVAVRYGTVHGTAKDYSFTEPTLLLPPGKKAEDYISLDAVTVANMNGQSHTYSWDPQSPPFPFPNPPAGANIAELNLKSIYKPFFIYLPGTTLGPYGNPPEIRQSYSHFPTWNHWPVNQAPSDGRYAVFPDSYASAAVMSPDVSSTWIEEPGRKSTYFLFGLTDEPAEALAPLARSWVNPPRLELLTAGFSENGYDKPQRAYIIVQQNPKAESSLRLKIEASSDSPIYNPVFVIKNWGTKKASVKIDGRKMPPGLDLKEAHIKRMEGTDLVVWIRKRATQPITIRLAPIKP